MQNKHQFFFFSFGRPNLGGGGGGSTWLGQIPKFFQKFDLKAPLILDVIKIARISPATAKSGYASSSCLGPCIVCAALPKASGCSPAKCVPTAAILVHPNSIILQYMPAEARTHLRRLCPCRTVAADPTWQRKLRFDAMQLIKQTVHPLKGFVLGDR